MYRKTLCIELFCVSDVVGAVVDAQRPFERFSHKVSRRDKLDDEAFCSCDIAIMDASGLADWGFDPLSLRGLAPLVAQRRKRRGAKFGAVAVIATPDQLASWTEADYRLVDAVWTEPLGEARIACELERLQREAKLAADLRLTSTYLDTAIDSTYELVWFKDARGSHLKVNDAFCATVAKTKGQVEGRGHYYIWDITPEEYDAGEYVCLESEDETMAAGRTCLFDEQVKTKRGMRQFKTYKTPLFDEDGSVMGTVGVAHDVTDLDNIATELDILINAMPFSMVVEDADGVILNANRETERSFNVEREAMIGTSISVWRRIVFGEELARRRERREDPEFTAVIGGKRKTFAMTKAPIVDVFGNETGLLRIYRDVTNERELEARALSNARTDYLTGLFNRRYFYEYLDERGRSEPLSLIVLDLDDFKAINDAFGHAVGDEALLNTSAILRETFPDCPVIRWGGDEFVVAVFGDRDVEDIRRRADELLARLESESKADARRGPLTGSIGIACTDDPALPIDELIKRSDEALYWAKRAGKSQARVYGDAEA